MNDRRKDAEVLALQALGWLMSDADLAAICLEMTGADAATLRERAEDPDLLAAVLDVVLSSDTLVTGFAQEAGIPPARVAQARRLLPGGESIDWI